MSSYEVAEAIGISPTHTKRVLRKAGKLRDRRVPQEIKDEIIRLYVEEKMTAREIGARIGMSGSAVGTHLHKSGKQRSISEAQALAAMRRPFKRGRGGWWQSTKTGKWEHAMSVMELLRMQQLDNDPAVSTWTRKVPTIKWTGGIYVPDLYVEYADGRRVVEEVKPSTQTGYEENRQKWADARVAFAGTGVEFKVVTEADLGGEAAIRGFNLGGLQGISPEEKRERKLRYWRDYAKNVRNPRRAARAGGTVG